MSQTIEQQTPLDITSLELASRGSQLVVRQRNGWAFIELDEFFKRQHYGWAYSLMRDLRWAHHTVSSRKVKEINEPTNADEA